MHHDLTIQRLLAKMQDVQASDLHVTIGSAPVLRIAANLQRLDLPPLDAAQASALLLPLVPDRLRESLDRDGGADFSHTGAYGRFRCSVFHAGGGLHGAIRRVTSRIPDFETLHLPPVYQQVAEHVQDGLVIVCGVTGSGKSSTLAAMIDHMNHKQALNIITIEDPVEYVFQPARSVISQREVGLDVIDFPTALRAAVRQDPDVIVIGEMRDRITLHSGLMAAETGHLVFVTLHTTDVVQCFSRILEFFPPAEHPFIRSCLANGLRAVLAQRLLPCCREGIKVVPATEVLRASPTVSDCIREGREDDLHAVIADSIDVGMHTFTDSLTRLVKQNYLDLRIASDYAPHPELLRSAVHGIEVKAEGLVSRIRH
jgi:twitching motility protein PilT